MKRIPVLPLRTSVSLKKNPTSKTFKWVASQTVFIGNDSSVIVSSGETQIDAVAGLTQRLVSLIEKNYETVTNKAV